MSGRRQYFAWAWPKPAPGPLDHDAVQRRWLRVAPRSAVTWLLLALGTGAVACVGAPALLVLLTAPRTTGLLGAALLLGAPILIAVWVLLRGWGWGVYVNDAGVKVAGLWRTAISPWPDIESVAASDGGCVHITLRSGRAVRALDRRTPDWWSRHEEFEIAALTLERWRQAC